MVFRWYMLAGNAQLTLQGSKTSGNLLESFAEKLAAVFVQGELCISDWSPEKGAEIKVCQFTKGPFFLIVISFL